jgi:hypothetical protein
MPGGTGFGLWEFLCDLPTARAAEELSRRLTVNSNPPNHVHILIQPKIALSKITKWIKGVSENPCTPSMSDKACWPPLATDLFSEILSTTKVEPSGLRFSYVSLSRSAPYFRLE